MLLISFFSANKADSVYYGLFRLTLISTRHAKFDPSDASCLT